MAQKAVIEDGVVTNIIEVGDVVPEWAASFPDASVAMIGDAWDGTTFSRSATYQAAQLAAARAAMSLSFAQLMIGLVTEGWITEADGDAWVAGTLPAQVTNLIATLPTAQQFAAKVRAISPSVVLRTDSLVVALGQSAGKTDADLDAFFTTYAAV